MEERGFEHWTSHWKHRKVSDELQGSWHQILDFEKQKLILQFQKQMLLSNFNYEKASRYQSLEVNKHVSKD